MRTLSTIRRAQGLTQGELATRVGVGISAVKAWENGRRRPSPTAIARLYKALGLTAEDIARIVYEGHREVEHLRAELDAVEVTCVAAHEALAIANEQMD